MSKKRRVYEISETFGKSVISADMAAEAVGGASCRISVVRKTGELNGSRGEIHMYHYRGENYQSQNMLAL